MPHFLLNEIELKCHLTTALHCLFLMLSIGGTGCSNEFSVHLNTLSAGGTLQYMARTMEECRAVCLPDNTCYAFDFDIIQKACYTHKPGYLSQVKTTVSLICQLTILINQNMAV